MQVNASHANLVDKGYFLQVLSAVKDGKRRKGDKHVGSKGGGSERERLSEPTKFRSRRSTSSDREDTSSHKEQRSGSEKKVWRINFVFVFVVSSLVVSNLEVSSFSFYFSREPKL
jgi:hypothetical protein